MEKLVSIVLPVYNGEKYLAQSIESVLNQTYRNIELIIVNDCSTDSTEDIILQYMKKDNRIVYVRNEANSKLPKSLNNGFAIAKGEYYTWTSDDNIYHNDAIETMVEELEKNDNIGLVYCDINLIDENGDFQQILRKGENEDLLYANVIGACFLYRRSVALKVGKYDESFFLVEDYEYWLRINLHYDILHINKVLYDYRAHGESLSYTRYEDVNNALEKLLWVYLPKYELNHMPEDELFKYFEYILKLEKSRKQRIRAQFIFMCKHRRYFFNIAEKLKHNFRNSSKIYQ